jgi:tetratricopeptide (TPR) repeat protein
VQPGTADEQDLAWAAKVLEQKQQSEVTAEFLDLQARHTEVLAMHATAKGQHTEAASAWRKVADVIEQLAVMGNPLPAKLHRHYRLRAAILMNCAGQQLAAGEYPPAIEAVREALDVLGKIPADDADHAVDVIRSIEYSIPLAQMQLGLGQRSRAVATIEKSKLRLSEKAFVDPRLQAVADGLKMRLEQLRAEVTGEPAGLAP